VWQPVVVAFLVGAATGKWWSKKKAVNAAVASALAASSSQATSNSVVYVSAAGWADGETATDYDYDASHDLDTGGDDYFGAGYSRRELFTRDRHGDRPSLGPASDRRSGMGDLGTIGTSAVAVNGER